MGKILNILRDLIPGPVFEFFQPAYHYALAFLGALFYGFPSRRMVVIEAGQDFSVIVDYAHEPKSLESVYRAVINSGLKASAKSGSLTTGQAGVSGGKSSKLICLLGAAGGGRDKWKRPEMGKIAAEYYDEIVLTNEDPYDEPPTEILNQIEEGIRVNPLLKKI